MNKMKEVVFQDSLNKELWDWLSKNNGKFEKHWPKWKSNGGDIADVYGHSFICEYAKQVGSSYHPCCEYCPLDASAFSFKREVTFKHATFGCKPKLYHTCLGGLREEWLIRSYNESCWTRKYALLIRNLPVKEGVIYE